MGADFPLDARDKWDWVWKCLAFAAFLWLCWVGFARRLWARGYDPPVVGERGRGLRAVFGA